MSGYGIEVFNEAGILQFTSDVKCLVFDRKITVNTGSYVDPPGPTPPGAGDWTLAWSYGSGATRLNIWNTNIAVANDEIIVIKSSFAVTKLIAWAADGWAFDYKTLVCNASGSNTAVPPASMEVYIFKNGSWGAGTSFECWDAAGVRTFSNANKTLRVPYVFTTANLTATATHVIPGVETFNVASGNWGVMTSVLRNAGCWLSAVASDVVADGVYSDSTHIYVKPSVCLGFDYTGYTNYYPFPGNASTNATTVFAVDLTGL